MADLDEREKALQQAQDGTENADVFERARTNQRQAEADEKAYVDAGTDQAEAFANDPDNNTDQNGDEKMSAAGGIAGAAAGLAQRGLQIAAGGLKTAGGFIGGHKKAFGAGGGVLGVILSLILGFTSLLPLKLESMMKNIVGDHSQIVENAMERRAMRMMMRYAARYSTAASGEGAVVATGNPLADLYKTWKTQKFEADLDKKYGLKIERSNTAGKTIKLTYRGGEINGSDEADLVKELSNKQAKAFINETLKSETKWHQVIKRAHLRRWMRNAYGVKNWKMFEDKKGKEAKTELDDKLKANSKDAYKSIAKKGMECLFGITESCPGRKSKDSTKNLPEGNNKADGKDVADRLIDKTADKTADVATKTAIAEATSKGILEIGGDIVSVIGLIDLGARMDKLVWDNTAAEIVYSIRAAQYGSLFSDFLKMSDQIKAGKTVSGDEVNSVMLKFDGAEKSAAFQRIYAGSATGTNTANVEGLSYTILGVLRQGYQIESFNICSFDSASGCDGNFDRIDNTGVYHVLTYTYMNTIGKLVDGAFDVLGSITDQLSKIPGASIVTAPLDWLTSKVGQGFQKAFEFMAGRVVTGNETADLLFTTLDVGGDVTYNDFARYNGGQVLTAQQAFDIKTEYQQNQAIAAKNKGIFYALTSTDNPGSLVNLALAKMPVSSGAAFKQTGASMLAVISSPFNNLGGIFKGSLLSTISPARAAAPAADPYGIDQYGFTQAQLDADIDDNALAAAAVRGNKRDPRVGEGDNINVSYMLPEDCDEDPDNPVEPNMCKLDLTVAQALKAMYTTEDDGGVNSLDGGVVGGAAGGTATTPGTGSLPTGAASVLAQEILSNPKITLEDTTVRTDLQDTVNGQAATAGAPLSRTLLAIIAALGRTHTISISALEDEGRGHATDSVHYSGRAVDFTAFDGKRTDGRDPQSIALIDAIKAQLPSGSGIGQEGCPGGTPVLPAGINTFADSCTHVHVQIPRTAE